jgi:hypothetical protein
MDLRWQLTLSKNRGTYSPGTLPGASEVRSYEEYKDPAWNSPSGPLYNDQRNRVRAWAIWDAFSSRRNNLSVSLLQTYVSGTPYAAVGTIDSTPYVENPGYITPPATGVSYYFTPRGAFRTETVTSTDIAVNYSFFVNAGGSQLELFIQPEVLNVFNESAAVSVDTTVYTAFNDPELQTFNPFAEEPVEGVHWRKGTAFGEPIAENHYQSPRVFRFSLGVRF